MSSLYRFIRLTVLSWLFFAFGTSGSAGSFFIHNASGIQIGNNNTLSIRGHDPQHSLLSTSSIGSATSHLRECISKYGKSLLLKSGGFFQGLSFDV